MKGPSRRVVSMLALVSAAFVLASPLVALVLGLVAHAVSFRGVCGPYAPDIPEHACGFGTYVVNFFSPFAVAGMCVLAPVILTGAAMIVLAAWALGAPMALLWKRRRRPET